MGLNAARFSGPLPAGEYTFWVQETGTPTVNYQLRFLIETVPAAPALPAGCGLLLGAGFVAAGVRKIRSRRSRGSS